jgi:o-succinylbenzoate---CoA ligase
VLGRRDDVIVSGGENVPANAVAATLRTLRSVADAAVTGRPDPDWGEVVVAVVAPADRAAPPTLGELRAHVAAHHPAAFAPRDLVVVDALPRDAMGKLSRERLLALL